MKQQSNRFNQLQWLKRQRQEYHAAIVKRGSPPFFGNRPVKWLDLGLNKRRLGEGHGGSVIVGKMLLEGSTKPKRVAVKFHRRVVIDDQKAQDCWNIIQDLRRAGVRLPKMGFVKDPGHGWVLVMEPYMQKGKSRLKQAYGMEWHIDREDVRRETIIELTKVANAGYFPDQHLVDYLESGSIRGTVTRPIDLDRVFEYGKMPRSKVANKLLHNIWMMTNNVPERYALLQLARGVATPTLRKTIASELKKVTKTWFRSSSEVRGNSF
jgi:hypothetical protein